MLNSFNIITKTHFKFSTLIHFCTENKKLYRLMYKKMYSFVQKNKNLRKILSSGSINTNLIPSILLHEIFTILSCNV